MCTLIFISLLGIAYVQTDRDYYISIYDATALCIYELWIMTYRKWIILISRKCTELLFFENLTFNKLITSSIDVDILNQIIL